MPLVRNPERGSTYTVIDQNHAWSGLAGACRLAASMRSSSPGGKPLPKLVLFMVDLFAKPTTYASTHGSPWAYDTNVPLAMYGPSWINPGKYGDSEVVDLARTIAFILNVRPPNGCEGGPFRGVALIRGMRIRLVGG